MLKCKVIYTSCGDLEHKVNEFLNEHYAITIVDTKLTTVMEGSTSVDTFVIIYKED